MDNSNGIRAKKVKNRVNKSSKKLIGEKEPYQVRLKVNGIWYEFEVGRDIQESHTLAYVLREKLGLTGLKVSCDEGACGACTVIMDGKAILSCMTLAVESNGRDILTIEGLRKDDPIILAFAEQCEPGYGTALQCGICTPGFVMAAKALLNENPNPTLQEINDALSGNICRCGCYPAISRAVLNAVKKLNRQGEEENASGVQTTKSS